MTQPPAGQPPRGPHPPRGHRGPGAFGPPQGGRGYGPPQGGFGPPPGRPGTPPRGFGPPLGDFGPPQGGYGTPAGGFGPPPGPPQDLRQGSRQRGRLQGAPQGPPQGPPPPLPQGERQQPKKGAGKIVAIVVVLVVLGLGGFAAWKLVGPGASDSLAAAADPGDGAAGAPSSCSLVSGDDLNAVLGDGGWTALDTGAAVGRVYDSRLLAGVPKSCWVTDSLNEKLSRVARYDGGDAAARFAEEKRKAQSGAFLGKDVPGGDEAFCTTPNESSSAAGALVRRGDTLIYVGTTAAGPDADAGCALAVQIVEKVR
jgi:hypothetical protein